MSVYLLDINVLVALLWTNHEHHQPASNWFKAHQKEGWATCPFTQTGFVRVSSNPRVFPHSPPAFKAVEILEANLRHPMHQFFKNDISLAKAVSLFEDRFRGHQQITDAYLFGLAIHKRAVLVTFDKSVAALVGEQSVHLKSLEVLSA